MARADTLHPGEKCVPAKCVCKCGCTVELGCTLYGDMCSECHLAFVWDDDEHEPQPAAVPGEAAE
jgi:hypothetical protein